MIEAQWDLSALAREQWKRFGRPPAQLLALTPQELVALFAADGDGEPPDPLAELHRVNHVVRAPKGLPPVAPAWFAPEVPRG